MFAPLRTPPSERCGVSVQRYTEDPQCNIINLISGRTSRALGEEDRGRVEGGAVPLGAAYLGLPVSFGSASLASPWVRLQPPPRRT